MKLRQPELAEPGTSEEELCERPCGSQLNAASPASGARPGQLPENLPGKEQLLGAVCWAPLAHPGPAEPFQSSQLGQRVCSERRACPVPQNSRGLRVQLELPRRDMNELKDKPERIGLIPSFRPEGTLERRTTELRHSVVTSSCLGPT